MALDSVLRTKALVVKEFYQIIRDPSTFLISIVLPLILLFVYGFGVSLDIDHLKIGLVLEDTSPEAQSFAEALTNSRYFSVTVARHRNHFDQELIKGNLRGIVVIPSYFSTFKNQPSQSAPIQVIADASETNTANFVQNYVRSAWSNWLKIQEVSVDLKGLPIVGVQTRFWYNQELLSKNFLVPGSLAIIMTLIGTLLTALVVAREWERGTMEAQMATPVTIREILLGKLIPYFVLGMLSMVLSVAVALVVYDVPLRGSIFALTLCSMLFLFAALGLGLLISTLSKNQVVASQAALVTGFLPAFILSGFIFEISSMPMPIQIITYFIPARYFVSCLQTIFLAGDIWPLLLKNMVPMLFIGLLFFYITAKKTVKRLD